MYVEPITPIPAMADGVCYVVISASWAQKRLIPTFYVYIADVRGLLNQKSSYVNENLSSRRLDSSELDSLAVRCHLKKFLPADSASYWLDSWTQKRLIPTF